VLVIKPKNIKTRNLEPDNETESALKIQLKAVEERLADIKRWQSSKKNIFENKVRDNYKILEVLIP